MLNNIMKPENVFIRLSCTDQRNVLETMLDALVDYGDIADSNELVELLLDRERIMTTGIKEGFAVPHAFTNQVSESILMLATLEDGINWEALDDQPVKFVFLILNAPDRHDDHLQLLARLSAVMSDPTLAYGLKDVDSPEAAIALIADTEKDMTRPPMA